MTPTEREIITRFLEAATARKDTNPRVPQGVNYTTLAWLRSLINPMVAPDFVLPPKPARNLSTRPNNGAPHER